MTYLALPNLDLIANSLTFNWGPDWISNPIKEAYPAIPLSTSGQFGLYFDTNGIATRYWDIDVEVTAPRLSPLITGYWLPDLELNSIDRK
jgi:hypothetical protein